MANLRIIASNAARRATLTASSTDGLLAVTNLVSDKKSDVWRATSTTAKISGTLPASELASGVALLGNFSPATTMRVRLSNEQPASSLASFSEDFSNSVWAKTRATVTTNVAGVTAPDGQATVDKLCNNGIVDSNGYIKQNFTADGVSNFMAAVFVKFAGEVTTAQLDLVHNNGTQYLSGSRVIVDLTTGAVSGGGNAYSKVIDCGGGWYRLVVGGVPVAGTAEMRISLPNDSTAGTTGYYIWGAWIVPGTTVGSYYPRLTSAATTRPAGYIDSWQSYDYDSGFVPACPAPAIQLEGWTAAQSASAYGYGGGAYARAWFPETQFRGFAIDMVDTGNLQGYIEASKLVIGRYWSPPYGLSSLSQTDVDGSTHYSTAAGDLLSRASTISKEVSIEMRALQPADRSRLADILRASRAYPIFVSVRAGDVDLDVERAHAVLGKRMGDSEVTLEMAQRYGSKVTVRSI